MEFPDSIAALAALWFFFIGGSIGSFLNVVVYRLPLGLSIVRPSSHCPRCKTPILARDNLPVFGWLLLRGKCRACAGRISPRYPAVEAAAGLTLTLLAFCEPLADGVNLPIAHGPAAQANYPLLGMAAYHFALLTTLGGAALMLADRAPIPRSYWTVMLAVGLLPPLVWPLLRPVPSMTFAGGSALVHGAVDGLLGFAVGGLLGFLAAPAAGGRESGGMRRLDPAFAGACLGAYLGWQAACGAWFVAVLVWSLGQLGRRFGAAVDYALLAVLAATTLAWLCAWRGLADFVRWNETPLVAFGTPWYIALVAGSLTWALAAGGGVLGSHARTSNPNP